MAHASSYPKQPIQQVSHKSPQDVRNDPNYINQGTQENKATSQPQGPPQEGAMYVKYPIPIGNEMPSATGPEVQPAQPQEQQQVPQGEGSQMSQAQQ